MSKLQSTRIACYAVIAENSKILLCRLSTDMVHRGKWTLPGGGLNFGESLEQALEREVFEETGLTVTANKLLTHNSHVWEFPDKSLHGFQFLFSVTNIQGNLRHETKGSTDLVAWVDIEGLTEDNSVDIVRQALGILTQPSAQDYENHRGE